MRQSEAYPGALLECPDGRVHIANFPIRLSVLQIIEIEGSPKGGYRAWAMFKDKRGMSLLGTGSTPPEALESLAKFWREELAFHEAQGIA